MVDNEAYVKGFEDGKKLALSQVEAKLRRQGIHLNLSEPLPPPRGLPESTERALWVLSRIYKGKAGFDFVDKPTSGVAQIVSGPWVWTIYHSNGSSGMWTCDLRQFDGYAMDPESKCAEIFSCLAPQFEAILAVHAVNQKALSWLAGLSESLGKVVSAKGAKDAE